MNKIYGYCRCNYETVDSLLYKIIVDEQILPLDHHDMIAHAQVSTPITGHIERREAAAALTSYLARIYLQLRAHRYFDNGSSIRRAAHTPTATGKLLRLDEPINVGP